jgi:hypothetical protein
VASDEWRVASEAVERAEARESLGRFGHGEIPDLGIRHSIASILPGKEKYYRATQMILKTKGLRENQLVTP